MIKNECKHAYKLLDHAECLWCENCVEKLTERLSKKPQVTEGFVEKWMDIMENYDNWSMRSRVTDMLKEASVEIK